MTPAETFAPARAHGPGTRRFFVPEVVQTSGMDCGPAALAALLRGHGIEASYARLREACRTTVDGTSIQSLAGVAQALGVECAETMAPVDHLLLREAALLPAIVATVQATGLLHFVVVWRTWGPWVQLMDPGRGRRWARKSEFLREVAGLRARITTEQFEQNFDVEALQARLCAAGFSAGAAAAAIAEVRTRGWVGVAALDAAVRAASAIGAEARLPGGEIVRITRALIGAAEARLTATAASNGGALEWLPEGFFSVLPDGEGGLSLRGAVLLQITGRVALPTGAAAPDAAAGLPPDLAAVLQQPGPGPVRQWLALLRAAGGLRWLPLLFGFALVALGGVFEALLFRGLFELGDRLPRAEHRIIAMAVLLALVLGVLLVEWPLHYGALALGRRIERGLRERFSRAIGGLGERYFQTRPVADLAERAHAIAQVRLLPELAGKFVQAVFELLFVAAAICWLHPSAATVVGLFALATIAVPLGFSPALAERDLRMRDHGGALHTHSLDGMLGLQAIRAHAAETALRREFDGRLREWAGAAWAAARAAISLEIAQSLLGFAFTAWLLFDYLTGSPDSAWALLLLYWGLYLPNVGQELAFLAHQYPRHRNATLRLLEPLGAMPGEQAGAPGEPVQPAVAPAAARGVALSFREVAVVAGGHELLTIAALDIAAGEHVALVGASGAGKTSFLGLVLGWHPPASGRVMIDGRLLDRAALARLRGEAMWIAPEVYLWNRSLLENLRFGAPPGAPVETAIGLAELDEVLARLPVGLQTTLGEGGTLVSGGEGQRVRIARALARGSARLVALDEAFRGLERQRRRGLLTALRAHVPHATFLCATHDVADTESFDRVVVINDGRVVESGPPAELLRQPGSHYARLHQADRAIAVLFGAADWRQVLVKQGRVQGDRGGSLGTEAGSGVSA